MLLEFQAGNYKNFANGFTFSMEANMEQNDLSYSVRQAEAAGRTFHILSSGVFYGPNAAGKSNMIHAVDTFKQIAWPYTQCRCRSREQLRCLPARTYPVSVE